MRFLAICSLLVSLAPTTFSSQGTQASLLEPWDIKEVTTFHGMLHHLGDEYSETENKFVLTSASGELKQAFIRLQNATLPPNFYGGEKAYQAFIATIDSVFQIYLKACSSGNSDAIVKSFYDIDDTFEAAVPVLRKAMNSKQQ